jgi:hypothetical protein
MTYNDWMEYIGTDLVVECLGCGAHIDHTDPNGGAVACLTCRQAFADQNPDIEVFPRISIGSARTFYNFLSTRRTDKEILGQ